jgi:hypothetical protein
MVLPRYRLFAGCFTRLRLGMAAGLLLLCVASGCKTQDDAVAAAAQMCSAASTLSDYYDALDKTLAATEATQQANQILNGIEPVDPKIMKDLHHQLKLRKDLAAEIAKLAALMQQISAADVSANAASAAATFNAELVTINAIGSNDAETQGVTQATKLLISLIQMHEEVKAARQVEPVAHALALFFVSEERAYTRINHGYLTAAKQVSQSLVDSGQVDASALFTAPLAPFDLQLTLSDATKKKATKALDAQIDEAYDAKLAESQDAMDALADALGQMDARVSLVAHERPMKIRLEPITLKTVRGWIAAIEKELPQ